MTLWPRGAGPAGEIGRKMQTWCEMWLGDTEAGVDSWTDASLGRFLGMTLKGSYHASVLCPCLVTTWNNKVIVCGYSKFHSLPTIKSTISFLQNVDPITLLTSLLLANAYVSDLSLKMTFSRKPFQNPQLPTMPEPHGAQSYNTLLLLHLITVYSHKYNGIHIKNI